MAWSIRTRYGRCLGCELNLLLKKGNWPTSGQDLKSGSRKHIPKTILQWLKWKILQGDLPGLQEGVAFPERLGELLSSPSLQNFWVMVPTLLAQQRERFGAANIYSRQWAGPTAGPQGYHGSCYHFSQPHGGELCSGLDWKFSLAPSGWNTSTFSLTIILSTFP